jgi:5-formyltetrahydrofolate cyclo-ligase
MQTRKQALRQSIIARRLALPQTERWQLSQQIVERICQLNAYKSAVCVLGYWNFGAEFAAEWWVKQALQDGKILCLPKVNPQTKQLEIYRVTDLNADLATGMWGIHEPLPERCALIEDLSAIDFILLPGVAFSINGARLGYGGGFYDKLLARLTHRPTLLAAAFSIQMQDEIPQETTDIPVDFVVTEQQVFEREKQFSH